MKTTLYLFMFVFACATSFAQTPCMDASGTIVATGYSTTNDGYYQQCVGNTMVFHCENVILPNAGTIESVEWYINGLLDFGY
jgi:hypothetical protein